MSPDLLNGLPNKVSEEWGHPRQVTTRAVYTYCSNGDCCCCEGHYSHSVELDPSEWYWKPSVVRMDLLIPALENQTTPLSRTMAKIGKDGKFHWTSET